MSERPRGPDLRERVDRGRGLVQHQDVRIGDTGAQQRDQLAFTGRERFAALTDPSVESVGQRLDPVVDVEHLDQSLDLGSRRRRSGEADVGGDRVVEQERLLSDHDEPVAELVVVDERQGDTAESDLAGDRIGEAGDQPAECRLAGTRGAHDGDLLAGRDVGRDVFENDVVVEPTVGPRTVREGHVVDVDGESTDRQRLWVFGRRWTDRDVEDGEHPPQPCHGGLGLIEHLRELGDRFEEPIGEEHEPDQGPGGQSAPRPDRHTDGDDRRDRDHREHLPEREQERTDHVAADLCVGSSLHSGAGPAGEQRPGTIGTDRLGAAHQLRDGAQHLAVAFARPVVGADEVVLDDSEQHEQRDRDADRDQRQQPVVGEHHRRHDDHQGAVDQPRQTTPPEELGERLDVARHPVRRARRGARRCGRRG